MTRRDRIGLVVGIAVSIAFLWIALRGTSLQEILQAMGEAHFGLVPVFLLALLAYYWLKTVRWAATMAPVRTIPTRALFPSVMIGYASNTMLPMQLGELVRAVIASRQFRLRFSSVFASIVLERTFDFLVIPFLLALAMASTTHVGPHFIAAGYTFGALGLVLLAVVVAYILWTQRIISGARLATGFLPAAIQDKIVAQVELGAEGMRSIRSPSLLASIGVTTVLQWAAMLGCTYISLLALGLDVPFSASFVVLAFTIVGVTLPTSPGYIGSIQLAYTLALSAYGVPAGDAIAASVFFHVLAYSSVLLAGLYYLRRLGFDLSKLQSEASGAESGFQSR